MFWVSVLDVKLRRESQDKKSPFRGSLRCPCRSFLRKGIFRIAPDGQFSGFWLRVLGNNPDSLKEREDLGKVVSGE